MKQYWIAAGLGIISTVLSVNAAPTSLRMLAQNNYLPGLPVLVRVEGYGPDGSRDKETWDIDATLTADGGVALSTNKITLHNGMGSQLVTFTGGGNFNLTATVGGVSVTRPFQTLAGTAATKVGGVLSGGSGTWSGLINVTSDVIVTNYALTIQSNTLVLINGTASGTNGISLVVNAGGSIQSLGTELHPVTITCSNVLFANRWGQIRHNNSQASLYRHTFIHRAGRAPGEGHTSQAAAVRTSGSTLTFESATISDLCETSPAAPGFGTPAKVMFAVNSALTFNDCLFQRVRTGPEINGTSLLYTNSYVMETRGPDDSDGLYVHAQQPGQTVKIADCVFAIGDDDGIDTLGPVMSIENCLFRDWNSLIEDAKGISVFDGTTDVRRSLFTDCTVAIAAKTTSSVRVNINSSTFMGNPTNVVAAYKPNAPGPAVAFFITNSVLWGGNPVHSDFEPLSSNSTNFVIRYCNVGEPWSGAGNINSDPLFVNAATKNFRLRAGSPCFNAGNPASVLDVDGTVVDMGYFPFLTNPDPLIANSTVWKYLDNGSDPGVTWAQRSFNDSVWLSGPAQLGYGDGDEATVVSFGPDSANKYITTYFRRVFNVLNPSEFTNVEAHLFLDDGAVIYVNGQEVGRANLPGGPISTNTLALSAVEPYILVTNAFSPALLFAGTNVLAVEVHQQLGTSTDISFDLELQGQRVAVGNFAPSVSITAPSDGTAFSTPADVTITASANDSDGTVTSLALFQNNTLLFQTNNGSLSFTWKSVALGNYTLTAVATDDTGASSTSAPVNITVSTPSTVVTNDFIVFGNSWKYHDKGANLLTAWVQLAYDDSTWSNGLAQLGYGDGDEVTRVEDNPTPGYNAADTDRYITTYFRKNFNVTNAAAFTNLSLRLLRDDGGVAYLNGVEIFRSPNMPSGAILYNTLASGTPNGENTLDTTNFPTTGLLLEGVNILAVEIHQQISSSSDMSFDFALSGARAGDTNAKPIVSISSPAEGTIFGTPGGFTTTANAFDPDGTVTNVAFYMNGAKAGNDTNSPFTFATNNVPIGAYSLLAIATDNVGQSTTSAVVNVSVSGNVAPPVVFAKNPLPGSYTNLTSISVTFSKAVTGVDASDLLINGSPATGLSGSGSNYTFTFNQPAFGAVSITWATAHGITDLFTPSHAFNTNSAGANWQYQLLDAVPATIVSINPVANATVAALTSLAVTFNEPVTGVNAADLLINSVPASGLSGSGAGPYSFTFVQPAAGIVQVSWAGGHGIQDLTGNAFVPAPWSYTLDTNSVGVVISEIMYHPSSENLLEEYIELFNKGAGAVNLNGWRLSAGASFTFTNVSIPAGGYLVVAADTNAFKAKYPSVANVVGNWAGLLANSGEDIDLDDPNGDRVDSVRYADNGDWGIRQRGPLDGSHRGWVWFKPHDGLGASLELVNPNVSNNNGQNWAASRTINGTPGSVNSVNTNNIPPLILEVTHFPIVPKSSDPVFISARIIDESAGGFSVNLFWRVDAATPPAFSTVAMQDNGANGDAVANDGLYTARLNAQANNSVIEFYVSATDAQGLTRTWPAPAIAALDGSGPTGQVVNALFQVDDTVYAPTNAQPLYKLIMTESERAELQTIPSQSNLQGPNSRMNGTFISIDGSGVESHYSVSIRNRGHGSRSANPPNYHIDFRDDDQWKGRRALNINSFNPYLQHVASVLARKAGVAGANAIAVQVRVNNQNRAVSGGSMFGSYVAHEVQDSDFAGAHFPNDSDGNVYRAIRDLGGNFDYRGENKNAYTNTYYKESNVSEDDWTDLIAMLRVMGIGNTTPFTTESVRAAVNVEQWMRHLAVMNLFGNNETGLNTGYNDDYFMYAGANDRRFNLTYYDLDTILGQGGSLPATADIFTATNNNGSGAAFTRFMRWSEFEPIYYRTLYEILTGPFSQTNFDATVDEVLGPYVTVGTITSLKNWMSQRRAYVLSILPPITNSNAPTATITGAPRALTPIRSALLTVGGVAVASYQYSLNGGAYSAEIPVATPISLSLLPNGTNMVAVVGKGTNGVWQAFTNATVVQWVVNTSIPAVRINEVLAQNTSALNHNGTFPDAIELFNEGGTTVDLGGLRLSDDNAQPSKFTFPGGTLLAAGANLVLFANNADGTPGFHLGFSLDADGDSVHLYNSIANGGAELDSVKFGKQLDNLSIGRIGNSGEWQLTQPTFGSANVTQSLGNERNLRINEWLAVSQSQEEFVELYNPNSLPVALGGLHLTDNLIGDPARNKVEPLNFMGAGEYFALVANGNGNGSDHLNFKLSLEQGEIGLFASDLSVIDCVIYGPQQPDVAQGKCPNGAVAFTTLAIPTPGAPNACPFMAPPPITTTLITISNVWSYHATTNLDGVNWTTNTFNDSAWPTGLGLLGRYAVGQTLPELIRTTLQTNTTQTNFYFRTHFTVPPGTTFTTLQFRHIIDDGAVFYLNGIEIPGTRFNMPGGTISGATFAASTISAASYQGPVTAPLSMLRSGDNVFAVDVHQSATNSSDLAMGIELQGLIVTNSPAAAGVLINEVFANNASLEEPDGSKPDWVEIYNPSTNAVDLGDMSLTDDTTVSRRWIFPSGTILNSRAFLKVRFDADLLSSSTNTGFGLKANGGSVFLFNRLADGGSILSSIIYGLQAADFSIGRVPDGSTNWVLNNPSLGGANVGAALGNASLLKINEWMADPASGEDYFEIYNPNPQPVDVSRFYLTDDLSNRTKHQLPALSFMGVGQDAFQKFDADGNTTAGADHVGFSLRAAGEAVGISSATGVLIDGVSFGPQLTGVSQGRLPDGSGAVVSFATTSTPGKSNFLPIPSVLVNELLSHSDPPLEDAVEFYNPTVDPVDISGWYLSDSQNNLLKYRIPSNTVIQPHGYVVFYEYQFNPDVTATSFSFSSAKGDEVHLSQSFAPGTVTGYRAFASFGASENGVSFGRFRTSVGDDFTAMSARSFGVDNPATTNEFRSGTGLTNPYPRIGPIVINEIMYNPPSTNDALEFLELRNITGAAVPLYDTNNPANTWRLRKGIDFNFLQGITIPAGGYLVVVSFDPLTDPASLAAFQSAYGAGASLVGPYSGKLANGGEAVELQKPDAPQTIPGPDFGFVPYIVVDHVTFSPLPPWPTSPNGYGDALKKFTSSLYGNEPLNWQGGAPTPGAANFAVGSNTPPVLNPISDRSVHVGSSLAFTVTASDADLPGQILTYTLDAPVPAGASIGFGTGVFSWSPTTSQGPANYPIKVRVSDNGTPTLSDTKTFQVAVLNLPHVNPVQITNGIVTITWDSFAGRRYRVEATANLTTAVWTQVGSDVFATGTTSSLSIPVSGPQRFYRVISYNN